MTALGLGEVAPNFIAQSTKGVIHFHEWLGDSWGVFFAHPANHTPICTTEMAALSKVVPEFEKRNAKVIALSADRLGPHMDWVEEIQHACHVDVNFPLIADESLKIAKSYGMIHPGISHKITLRTLFIIGDDKKVKLTMTYPITTGRSMTEILRVLDSLQLTAYKNLATPADWEKGEDCILIPKTELVIDLDPDKLRELTPYLKFVPYPKEDKV